MQGFFKGDNVVQYKGMIDCFVKLVKNEGWSSLYKGLSANYLKVCLFLFVSVGESDEAADSR